MDDSGCVRRIDPREFAWSKQYATVVILIALANLCDDSCISDAIGRIFEYPTDVGNLRGLVGGGTGEGLVPAGDVTR